MEYLLPYLCICSDCTSYNGRIRENVGLQRCRISEVSLYVYQKIVLAINVNCSSSPIVTRMAGQMMKSDDNYLRYSFTPCPTRLIKVMLKTEMSYLNHLLVVTRGT